MGDWTVVVSGQGSHHNGTPGDADRLAQRFVEDLVEAQQMVRVAIVSYGGLGVLDTLTPARDLYERQLIAASQRDPSKNPYDKIAEKLAESDERQYQREKALGLVNLLPYARQKAHYEATIAHGQDVRYRYEKGHVRHRSVDGGVTWELAPDPDEAANIVADINVVGYTPNGDALILRMEALDRLGGDRDADEPARSAGQSAGWVLQATCSHCVHVKADHATDGRAPAGGRCMVIHAEGGPKGKQCSCTEFGYAMPTEFAVKECGHCGHFNGEHADGKACLRRLGDVSDPATKRCPCTKFIEKLVIGAQPTQVGEAGTESVTVMSGGKPGRKEV